MMGSHRDVLRRGEARLSRRKLAVPPPPPAFLPESTKISKMAEFLAEAYMVCNDILPFRASLDVGTDIVTEHLGIFKRVQVKGQASDGKSPDSFTFPTCRYENGVRTPYRPGEIDAFVFVHTQELLFFVMPAAPIIASKQCTITFSPTSHSKWKDAWWVLKT